jgi:hypothetical protein
MNGTNSFPCVLLAFLVTDAEPGVEVWPAPQAALLSTHLNEATGLCGCGRFVILRLGLCCRIFRGLQVHLFHLLFAAEVKCSTV